MKKCNTKNCYRETKETVAFCAFCRVKKWRENHPVEYTFANIKNRARQRGIAFLLTLEEWREWCERNNYIALRGNGKNDMTVDREYNDVGYQVDNMVMMTRTQNRNKPAKYKNRYNPPDVPF